MSSPMEGIENFDNPGTNYHSVWFKKKEGTLISGSKQLEFHYKQQQDKPFTIPWKSIMKHQVSPASYPKSLLKLILNPNTGSGNAKPSTHTFQMIDRPTLERLRNEITDRLKTLKDSMDRSKDSEKTPASSNRKRSFVDLSTTTQVGIAGYGNMDPTAIAVARSTLLSADTALRQQHSYLVKETNTVSEEDFWKTHHHLLEDEYARIAGATQAGNPSVLQSHLPSSGKVTLGVQEMRQIFIMYPAVHKAYEKTVPLELSDEQFWRKYLESEYFHRDRGRRGTVARNHASQGVDKDDKKNSTGPTYEQQQARAAAVGTDDMFSRLDQKLQAANSAKTQDSSRRKWGTRLAVGQFDLASTFETERGKLLEGPKDNYPPNPEDNEGRGSRVIQKYNRHWVMVLHPQEAIAGADLADASRRSSRDVLSENRDAYVMGGTHEEMERLVDYADATETDANHALGLSIGDIEYESLTLANIEAYHSKQASRASNASNGAANESRMHSDFAVMMAGRTQELVKNLMREPEKIGQVPISCFPNEKLGKMLLDALTSRMVKDSKTEAQSLELAKQLPTEFRERLQVCFRRSSELLRHFFGLRQMEGRADSQKMQRIVSGMETFYRKMEEMRLGLPQTETGEMMRKMCLPIMEQLNSAFKLHREGTGGGVGGGFVTVD